MDDDGTDPDISERRDEQAQVARAERHAAETAVEDNEALTHERRSERAAYLAAKLAEREESEREAAAGD
jgi:hypothetical protein